MLPFSVFLEFFRIVIKFPGLGFLVFGMFWWEDKRIGEYCLFFMKGKLRDDI